MKKKSIRAIVLEWVTKILKDEELEVICQPEEMKEVQEIPKEELQPEEKIIPPIMIEEIGKNPSIKLKNKKPTDLTTLSFDQRDIMEIMGVPLVSLSKNRTAPIIYDDGKFKLKISCHPPHYIASIYDWDIIQFVAGKMQKIMNSGEDIPPRTIIFPRHELFKAIHKQDGKKQHKDIKSSLSRLQTTVIETTIHNEDGRYDAGFGLLDSWGYTNRRDIKEIKITLSNWLYEVVCTKGALLKVQKEYFDVTSGLKKMLYRIARKHVGVQNYSWDFSIEDLHKKSGSERDLRKFKHDLKKVVFDNDLPDYLLALVNEDGKIFIRFINKIKYLEETLKQSNFLSK